MAQRARSPPLLVWWCRPDGRPSRLLCRDPERRCRCCDDARPPLCCLEPPGDLRSEPTTIRMHWPSRARRSKQRMRKGDPHPKRRSGEGRGQRCGIEHRRPQLSIPDFQVGSPSLPRLQPAAAQQSHRGLLLHQLRLQLRDQNLHKEQRSSTNSTDVNARSPAGKPSGRGGCATDTACWHSRERRGSGRKAVTRSRNASKTSTQTCSCRSCSFRKCGGASPLT